MTIKHITVIGECMLELSKIGKELKQGYGGDTLNTAIYLSRLTHNSEVTVSYATGLGRDPFSADMLNSWQQEGINTDMVCISEDKVPGIYAIETSDEGERHFYYWRNDSAAKYWLRGESITSFTEKLVQSELIYLSGISLAILANDSKEILLSALTHCHEMGISIVFDNNYRPALWENKETAQMWYTKVLQLTDIAFLTYEDEQALWGDTTEQQSIVRSTKMGIKEVVIKRGSDSCLVVTGEGQSSIAPTPISNIIDTTAAGDSFSAGYLAKRISGGSCQESARNGHILAGTVIQHRGAIVDISAMPSF